MFFCYIRSTLDTWVYEKVFKGELFNNTNTQIYLGEREVDQVIIGSLDALVDDEKSDNTTYGDFIPAEPDFYPGLFEDQIDDFLATLPDGRYKDVCEEFAYGAAYGESPKQEDMAVKYQCSQPQIARYRKKFHEQFRQFLDNIQKGDD